MRTTPDVLMVQAQRGWAKGAYYLWGKLLTLSPLYYVFLLQSRAHHFAHTLRWGGADYFATSNPNPTPNPTPNPDPDPNPSQVPTTSPQRALSP